MLFVGIDKQENINDEAEGEGGNLEPLSEPWDWNPANPVGRKLSVGQLEVDQEAVGNKVRMEPQEYG